MKRCQKWFLTCLSVLGFGIVGTTHAQTSAPPVIADAQIAFVSGLGSPQGITAPSNGTIYVADTANNRVVKISSGGVINQVSTGTYTLNSPSAVAIDSSGNLFIADSNNARVLEVFANGNVAPVPALNLSYPITLAVDPSGILYVGDGINNAVYRVTGRTTGAVSITNESNILPEALATDASGNLYIGDANSNHVYEVPAGGGDAQDVTPNGYALNSPAGVTFDAAGDMYVLDSGNMRVIEVPAGNASNPYQVPITGLASATSLAVDPSGNLYVADLQNNNVTELIYAGNSVNLGAIAVGGTGAAVQVNYELNADETLSAFKSTVQGDAAQEARIGTGTTCQFQSYTVSPVGSGNSISPVNPFVCFANVQGTPLYPGTRIGEINLLGSSNALLVSMPFTETGTAPVAWISPGLSSAPVTGLTAPQGIAISGQNKLVYIADAGSGKVYSWNGLSGSGSTVTTVATPGFTLSAPSAVALNGAGDLFIADYGLDKVIVVPANTAIAPFALNTGSQSLDFPVSLTFDSNGNLFIGDGGPSGEYASSSSPGFVVKVPSSGGPVTKISTGATNVIFPQVLAADASGNLYIADGGDEIVGGGAQVVVIPADGAAPSTLGISGLLDPAGLAIDPAGDLWVLDSENLGYLTVVAPGGGSIYQLPIAASSLGAPTQMVFTAGATGLLIPDLENGHLTLLNGLTAELTFPQTAVSSQSGPLGAAIVSIGTTALQAAVSGGGLYSFNGNTQDFNAPNSSTCFGFTQLLPTTSCAFAMTFTPMPPDAGTESESITSTFNSVNQVQLLLAGSTTGAASVTASPTFSPEPGTYAAGQSVTISDSTPAAVIHYTVDNSTPTTSSPVYTSPILVNSSTTLKALAIASGDTASPVTTASYTIETSTACSINFGSGFPSGTGLALNGSAKVNSGNLKLTDGGGYEAGSAYCATPVNVQSFTSNFTFQLTSASANGFTFTIQDAGTTALGNTGGGLGYGVDPNGGTGGGIGDSVAITFELYSGSGEVANTIGMFTDGASPTTPSYSLTPSGITLSSGDTISAQLSYDGTTLTLNLTDTVTNKTYSHAFTINIPSIVGSSTAYVGFTGGTGGLSAIQNIKTWTFTSGISQAAASPVFDPLPGAYTSAQNVTLSSATPGSVIYYTTDGSTPTHSSAIYSAPIVVSGASATIRAFAFAAGYDDSPVVTGNYQITTINFGGGFSSTTGLQLNGSAKKNSSSMELTDGGGYEAGSAYWTAPVNIQSFTTNFTFQLASASANGFTFTIQNAGVTALGNTGGGLGYGVDPNGGTGGGIGNSVAITFELYSGSGEVANTIGIFTDGAPPTTPSYSLTSSGITLSSGDTISAELVYNGATLTLNITDTVTNKTYSHAFTVNIPSTVGGDTAYVGFTGGTGGLSAIQNIKTWTFTSGTP
jgi:sugar lactone lactonase YvrE